MNPFSYLLNPVVFLALLVILSVLFILTAKSVLSQDKEAEEAFKKAISDKEALEKELSLKTQMFEGLKGQYNELEKDYEKLAQKAQEAPKPKPAASAQAITPPPQAMPSIKPEPQQPEPQKPEPQKPEEQKSEPGTGV